MTETKWISQRPSLIVSSGIVKIQSLLHCLGCGNIGRRAKQTSAIRGAAEGNGVQRQNIFTANVEKPSVYFDRARDGDCWNGGEMKQGGLILFLLSLNQVFDDDKTTVNAVWWIWWGLCCVFFFLGNWTPGGHAEPEAFFLFTSIWVKQGLISTNLELVIVGTVKRKFFTIFTFFYFCWIKCVW